MGRNGRGAGGGVGATEFLTPVIAELAICAAAPSVAPPGLQIGAVLTQGLHPGLQSCAPTGAGIGAVRGPARFVVRIADPTLSGTA